MTKTMTDPRNIAIIMGGDKEQEGISRNSAETISLSLKPEGHSIYIVKIDQQGNWYAEGSGGPVPVDKATFSMKENDEVVSFDFAFIAYHGKYGKGQLQEHLERIGIPFDSSSAAVSELADDKFRCKQAVSGLEVKLAKGVLLQKSTDEDPMDAILRLQPPYFVKPNKSGASLGATKVSHPEDLSAALENAFQFDGSVLIEEFVQGREIQCAVVRSGSSVIAFPLIETVYDAEFYSHTEKMKSDITRIIPAGLDPSVTEHCRRVSREIYDLLGCRGFIRIDYLLKGNDLYFLEVNTLPSLAASSSLKEAVHKGGMDIHEICRSFLSPVTVNKEF